jgi:hypothetical protein
LGEPVADADFADPAIAEDKNAAPLLLAASAAAVQPSQMFYNAWTAFLHLPVPPEFLPLLDEYVSSNGTALVKAREARRRPGAAWGLGPPSAFDALTLGVAELTDAQEFAALHAFLRGDGAAAIEYVRDLLFLATCVDRCPSQGWDCHGSANSAYATADHVLERICSALSIEPAGAPASQPAAAQAPAYGARTPSTRPATRRQISELIEELVRAEAEAAQNAVRALHAERLREWAVARAGVEDPRQVRWRMIYSPQRGSAARDGLSARLARRLDTRLRPQVLDDAAAQIQRLTALADARRSRSWSQAQLVTATVRPPRLTGIAFADRLSYRSQQFDYLGYAVSDWNAMVFRRVAALRLAIRLYQHDHGGRVPPDLAALVPAYIPFIPDDPYARSGTRIGYRTLPQPFLYSVNRDGIDDLAAGRFQFTDVHRVNRNRFHDPDLILPLDAEPRPPDLILPSKREVFGGKDDVP